jgi:hypothetical protein
MDGSETHPYVYRWSEIRYKSEADQALPYKTEPTLRK